MVANVLTRLRLGLRSYAKPEDGLTGSERPAVQAARNLREVIAGGLRLFDTTFLGVAAARFRCNRYRASSSATAGPEKNLVRAYETDPLVDVVGQLSLAKARLAKASKESWN